jgi:ACS family hexuronate transporter-like MFS transporter
VGAVVGIGGMAGSVGGVLFALSTGWILEWTHSYGPLFAIASTAYLVAILALRLLSGNLRRVEIAQ